MRTRIISATLLSLLCASPAVAAEDGTVDFELFRPHADTTGYFSVPSASTLRHLQLGVSLWGGYENDPVVLTLDGARVGPQGKPSGESGDALVDGRVRGHLALAMGIGGFSSLAVELPVTLAQQGTEPSSIGAGEPTAIQSAGLNDMIVTPKFVAVNGEDFPVGLAISLPVSLPTGGEGGFLSDGGFGFMPAATLEISDDSVQARAHGLRAAVTVGYAVRGQDRLRDAALGSAFEYGVAGGWRPADPFELVAEFHGEVGGGRAAQSPAEALVGARFYAGDLVTVNLGGGSGVVPGVGAPDWRAFFGFTVAPDFDPNAKDSDGDGINDGIDACKDQAEDRDEYQDADGCPDRDNDADRIPDDKDQCPNDPEDDDGFQDNDGCPDVDNDNDGVQDLNDRCPNEAETINEYQDDDGCPDSRPRGDTDNDRIPDDADRCPSEPEDFDGFQDDDGCPDPDNDSDGIPDVNDRCRDAAETINGIDDEDGCPESRVQVDSQSIKISERIYFDTGKNTIQQRSFDLMDEIAAVLVAHPEIKRVRIEGHTDNVGPDNNNLKLSGARAEAVRDHLIRKGVAAGRLDARGFGEMYPLESNDTESGRAANRRVEFIIVERQ